MTFGRAEFSGQERITVNAGVMNRSAAAAPKVPVTLEIEGRTIETIDASIGANASASIAFAPFTLAEPTVRGTVKAGDDPLAADNAFHFVLSPSRPISVLIVDSADAGESSFYLSRALAIGKAPAFNVEVAPASRVSSGTLDTRSVVILNDAAVPVGLPGEVLRRFVERGGGLLVALGQRSVWRTARRTCCPESSERPSNAPAAAAPLSAGAITATRSSRSSARRAAATSRRRASTATARSSRRRAIACSRVSTTARWRRRSGGSETAASSPGRRASTASGPTCPQTPVFLPLIHQFVKYLAQYERTTEWATVGQVVDISAMLKSRADRIVMTPGGNRVTVPSSEPGVVELNEQGVYEVRAASASAGRADRIAVNLDPAESDLSVVDPQELVAAVTGRAGSGRLGPAGPGRDFSHRRRAPAGPLVVSAPRRHGPARRRNGDCESPVAE